MDGVGTLDGNTPLSTGDFPRHYGIFASTFEEQLGRRL